MSVVGDAQRYLDAAADLKGQLTKSFGHAHMAVDFDAEIDENTRDASADVITSNSAQRGIVNAARQIEAGENRSVNVQTLGNAKIVAEQQRKKNEKAAEDTRFVLLLDDVRAFAAQRGAVADNLEKIFEAKYGDAWREEMANQILDPDEIPQRREGESMEDYRARLEDKLIEEMIDPKTGKIKPEYENDPEKKEWAQWAKARYDQKQANRIADILKDPNASEAEQKQAVEKLEAKTGFNGVRQAEQALIEDGQKSKAVAEATDRDVETESFTRTADEGAASFGL